MAAAIIRITAEVPEEDSDTLSPTGVTQGFYDKLQGALIGLGLDDIDIELEA
jgi:hypothetical protein